ncbi:AraC family transcriptional regulator [Campylobacter sp. faydin G-140]|uniref:AraC family transcriptional regulator n=1 Tax=Campylobacter anatolicus TaxID=2829105 RepID=UPI001B9DF135|nr:AraC family transcriptional regulator [Campylobacter anatolicus]MBR8465150.1 AraC family transcriptional regulator [Campylobacter anatolicus]
MDTRLEQTRFDLVNFINSNFKKEGNIETQIKQLTFFTSSTKNEFVSTIYQPSLCIILQGEKTYNFGSKTFISDGTKFLLTLTYVPTYVRISSASKDQNYIGLKLTLDMEQIYEVVRDYIKTTKNKKSVDNGLFLGELDYELLDPVARLINLLSTSKENIKFIAPLIIKEILFKLIQGDGGEFLKQYVLADSTTNKIARAIGEIKNKFSENINMKDLAHTLGLSESSLYHKFKELTMMSPVQFQKTLRLQEAKSMLEFKNMDASDVAFAVGYESASQFSREYSRMFNVPPKTHARNMKEK